MRDDPIKTVLFLWSHSPGDYFCISTKSRTGKWRDNFFKRRERRKAIDFIKSKPTCDIYICPHGFSRPKRLKEFSIDTYWLYADLDECDPKTLDIKPTMAFESSPGRYVGFWLCDNLASEELNKRLTYHISSDISGWDRTQVLRVPGTTNYKYKEKPKVKILWKNGPTHQTKRLERMVPKIKTEDDREQGGEAQEIYEEYESELSRQTRKELTNPQVKLGKRSEVLWKIIHECVEVGMKQDEIFTLLWDNGWNKFQDRRGGERMLERQIRKAFGEHVGGSAKIKRKKKSIKRGDDTFFKLVPMDQVEEEYIDWLVPDMIARGQIAMFEGDPGVGKSYFVQYLCIHFCDGKRLPWDKRKDLIKPLRVVYCDTENLKGAVTRVRLSDNGLKNLKNYIQIEQPFSFMDDKKMDAFESEVIEAWKPDVVIIDPIALYMGGSDSHKADAVAEAFERIKEMCKDHNFALIFVRHLTKTRAGGSAIHAGAGSVAFTGAARVVSTVGWHPEEPNTRVVACTKTNTAMKFGSLGYSINSLPPDMRSKNRSELVYEGRVDFMSDEILGTSGAKEDDSTKNIAADLIREFMAKGGDKIPYHRLLAQADKRSISEPSIKRAAADLGLTKITRGKGASRRTFLVDKSA